MNATAALPARPVRNRRLGRGTLVALALLAATALALGLIAGRHNHSTRPQARAATYTAGDGSFSVSYPAGWRVSSLGPTGAVIQRDDRRGLVLVRERPPLKGTLANLVRGLPRELRKRFPDFRPAGASVARLSTGPAVLYTFFRTRARKVQSIVVAPAPRAHRSFTLEVVAPAGARDAARQAGQIVRSLRTR